MAKELTPAQLAAELRRRQGIIRSNLEPKMMKAAANVEGRAKIYCTPGESPYPKAPYQTGFLRRAMTSGVIKEGDAVVGVVGNGMSYAVAVHEGSSRMAGRPFILDAIKDEKETTAAILGEAVTEGCA